MSATTHIRVALPSQPARGPRNNHHIRSVRMGWYLYTGGVRPTLAPVVDGAIAQSMADGVRLSCAHRPYAVPYSVPTYEGVLGTPWRQSTGLGWARLGWTGRLPRRLSNCGVLRTLLTHTVWTTRRTRLLCKAAGLALWHPV